MGGTRAPPGPPATALQGGTRAPPSPPAIAVSEIVLPQGRLSASSKVSSKTIQRLSLALAHAKGWGKGETEKYGASTSLSCRGPEVGPPHPCRAVARK